MRFDNHADATSYALRAIRSVDCRRVEIYENGVKMCVHHPVESSEA